MQISRPTASTDHAEALAGKVRGIDARRKILKEACAETIVQAAGELCRDGRPPFGERVQFWAWMKSLDIPGAAERVSRMFGTSTPMMASAVKALENGWDPNSNEISAEKGKPPLLYPDRGDPCVYAFHDNAGVIIYVGRSENLRGRMKHHEHKNKAAGWRAWICQTRSEMVDLEAILIIQHRPRLNYRIESRNGSAA